MFAPLEDEYIEPCPYVPTQEYIKWELEYFRYCTEHEEELTEEWEEYAICAA